MSDALMPTYNRFPVAFSHGEGAWLWDDAGNAYLDGLAGIAVCGLGHAHPEVTEAIRAQAGRLVHTSNLYEIPLQAHLAEQVCRLSGMDRAFFCNSGAEANEAAIKLARLKAHGDGNTEPAILVTDGAFHGRTMGALTATGNRKAQAGFEPLLPGFVRIPYGDLAAAERVAGERRDIAAVLVEPIQGESGVTVPPADYLPGLRRLCDEQGWLLMLDEVQTGIGRTGTWLAHQAAGVRPDVVTVAKSLANGVPIGALMARGAAAETFGPGNHGSTFGGNPLASAAALAVIEAIERDGLAKRAAALGARIRDGLQEAVGGREEVAEIRGRGLMLGVELDRPCRQLIGKALEHRVLVGTAGERVVRLLPPLILTDDEADMLVQRLAAAITAFLDEG